VFLYLGKNKSSENKIILMPTNAIQSQVKAPPYSESIDLPEMM
jgi:hypothetical protein